MFKSGSCNLVCCPKNSSSFPFSTSHKTYKMHMDVKLKAIFLLKSLSYNYNLGLWGC